MMVRAAYPAADPGRQLVGRQNLLTIVVTYAFFTVASTCIYLMFASIGEDRLDARSGDSLSYQVLVLCLYASLALVFPFRAVIRNRASALSIIGMLAVASLCAYATADVTFVDFTRFGLYIGTLLFGVWAAETNTVDRFFDRMFRFSGVVAAAYFAAYPLLSRLTTVYDPLERNNLLGFSSYAGAFAHKNLAGAFFGLATLIGITVWVTTKGRIGLWRKGVTILCFLSLLVTGAVSPFLALLLSLVSLSLTEMYRSRRSFGVLLIVLSALFVILVALFYGELLTLLGRDANFTGRSSLYSYWFDFFRQKPVFGYGFARFFSSENDQYSWTLNKLIDPHMWHLYATFESGYLQFGIDFGLVGLVLLAILIVGALRQGLRLSRGKGTIYAYCPLGVVLYVCFSSLTDTYLTVQNTLYPALLLYVFAGPLPTRVARREYRPHLSRA